VRQGGGGRRSGRRWLRGRNGIGVRRLSSSSPAMDGLSLPLFSGDGFHPPLRSDRKIAAGTWSESTVGTGARKLASPAGNYWYSHFGCSSKNISIDYKRIIFKRKSLPTTVN
jgi:hypothetical protein